MWGWYPKVRQKGAVELKGRYQPQGCSSRHRATRQIAGPSKPWPQASPEAPEEPCACPLVKPVREPDAGDPHVRFDERRRETEPGLRLRHRHYGESRRQQLLPRPTATAPAADSTLSRPGSCYKTKPTKSSPTKLATGYECSQDI